MTFKEVTGRYDGPALENEVLEFWREHDTYCEQTLQQNDGTAARGPLMKAHRPQTANLEYTMCWHSSFQGCVSAITKPCVVTHVPRKAGWDTHGLPVEHEIEKELGIFDKKEIEEKVGIAEFTNRVAAASRSCATSVTGKR